MLRKCLLLARNVASDPCVHILILAVLVWCLAAPAASIARQLAESATSFLFR